MSDRQVPVYVDTRRIFQQEAVVGGFVELERLPRFRQSLVSDEAEIQVELRFCEGDSGYREIHGHLQARVEVACQRCLEPMAIDLADQLSLALVRDDEQASRLKPELDPWICPDIKLVLADLIEEQLILSLPIVAAHEEGHCQADTGAAELTADTGEGIEEEVKENPFAILEQLKKSD